MSGACDVTRTDEGGHIVVPDAGTGGQGHELLRTSHEPFYAHAVHGITGPAQRCPEKADVRIVRGPVVPDAPRLGG